MTEELCVTMKKTINSVLDDAEMAKGQIESEFRLLLGVDGGEAGMNPVRN
jgi:hypothetical protein